MNIPSLPQPQNPSRRPPRSPQPSGEPARPEQQHGHHVHHNAQHSRPHGSYQGQGQFPGQRPNPNAQTFPYGPPTGNPYVLDGHQHLSFAPHEAKPQRSTQELVSIALAGAGALVMLIGVALLLVVAAREGILTPGVRVAGGAVLALGLAVGAHVVRPRPGGRLGSVALLGSAAATMFFGAFAITQIYHWIHPIPGSVAAFVLCAMAAMQAVQWNERWLYVALCCGVGCVSVLIFGEITMTLLAFLTVIQAAGTYVDVAKGWRETSIARTLPVAFFGMIWALQVTGYTVSPRVVSSHVLGLCLLAVVAAIGVGSAALVTRRLQSHATTVALGLALLPILLRLMIEPNGTVQWTAASLLALLLAVATATPGLTLWSRITVAAAGVWSALIAVWHIPWGEWMPLPWLMGAAGLFVAQHVTRHRDRVPALIACGVIVVALAQEALLVSPGDFFYRSRVPSIPVEHGVVGLVMALVGALALWTARGQGDVMRRQLAMVMGGTTGLYGVISATLTFVGRFPEAFFPTHVVVSVFVVVVASVVLMLGLHYPAHLNASLIWGGLLIGCALLKLLMFDLQYMDFVPRALAFIGTGLVLMVAGTRYARRYAESKRNAPGEEAHVLHGSNDRANFGWSQ